LHIVIQKWLRRQIVNIQQNKRSYAETFWGKKKLTKETKLRIQNITAKAALIFGSEDWVLQRRDVQRLEASQMKFLRHLLGITKLDKVKNQSIRGKKNWGTEHSKGNKTVTAKVVTTRTEDGHI
jgi:hypothetical protein